eukprot:Nitzschia sp. Nitz4//scaffold83_size84149//47405//48610//NITZ4_005175-RA/size84149-processed-gene-0.61-mRNA-1//-1//CDS//3329558950//1954//frame0
MLCSLAWSTTPPKVDQAWVEEEISLISELKFIVAQLKGHDKRLVRYNAMEHTHKFKEEPGVCDKLHHALSLLVDDINLASEDTKFYVCEMATLCITDHPSFRNVFWGVEGIHKVTIDLAQSHNTRVAAKAAHLIYIAAFANEVNHRLFVEQGAVEVLAGISKAKSTRPILRMYAMAALQNLAASYCTYSDGTAGSCDWGWTLEDEHIAIMEEDQTLLIDGGVVRRKLVDDPALFEVLKSWVCRGPAQGEPGEDNVLPGVNGLSTGRDDNNPAIVPWAAAGLLKNLSLEPSAKPMVEISLTCLCYMTDSADWLESSKSEDCLHFLRREGDPCWFSTDDEERLECIDRNFLDAGYSTCEDYENVLDEECDEHHDIFTGMPARRACCPCGGGYQLRPIVTKDEL